MVNANDIIKAVWRSENANPQAGVRQAFYFRADDPGNGDPDDIADDLALWLAAVWGNVAALLTVDYVATDLYVTNETQRLVMGTPAVVFAGTDPGDDLPGPDCGLVIARTGQLGRQGRKYIGPVAVSQQSEGVWNAGALVNLQNFADAYALQHNGLNSGAVLKPGVAQYPGNQAPPTFVPFVEGLSTAMPGLRTQRRRRAAVGI